MVLKLYGDPISTCTARVMVCLYEKDVEFELVPVDLFACEHKRPCFLAKNPFGLVPVLEDDGFVIFESRAITAYVSGKYKDSGTDLTRHNDLKESTLVRVWSEVESHQFDPAVFSVVNQLFVAPLQGKTPDEGVIKDNLDKLEKVLDVYEARLRWSRYLAGEFYSLADLHHLSYTHYFMKTPHASLIADRPHVKAWWEDVSSRPAFVKVAQGMTFGDKLTG